MKKYLTMILAGLALALTPAYGQKQEADFGGQQEPYNATVVVESVDFETTQTIDLKLPNNFKYVVETIQTIVRTAPSAVTTARLA